MLVEKIAAHEESFENTGRDSSGVVHDLKKSSIKIANTDEVMYYTRCRPKSGDKSYYYEEAAEKVQIVLHYTLGYLKGDIAALTRHDNHVSVPFVLGRNGVIYSIHPSKYWSYHLGRGAQGGNTYGSKRTIGIEISNIGGLNHTDKGMTTYYDPDDDVYCDLSDTDAYLKAPYRRFEYYATFTDAQYNSLNVLLKYLTNRYNIPYKFLDASKRYEAFSDIVNFKGIVSHVNYRTSGKEDIGPGFDWARIGA